ncbi:hypothetical protein MLD38_014496 [Melastoma candidum]|uniref:Uncharacterized protein n=1 Tax=Melastoma candidum TaxID=119954 RepID=A0ACB9RE54_9MYRT|nr:hypothetical protein MLD38_014496 [Melastoma candidum]
MSSPLGGYGFGMCWWDKRKSAGNPVSQFKWKGAPGKASGIIHSIDIHPSRKHICLAGGSLGTIFAWDRRWQKEPVFLSGVGTGGEVGNSVCESEVWEIRCDPYVQSQVAGNVPSSGILPVMGCSEDGILAVVKEGEQPVELMAEPCAINSFDINSHNPSEIVCSLEWESVAVLSRP